VKIKTNKAMKNPLKSEEKEKKWKEKNMRDERRENKRRDNAVVVK